MQVNVGSCRSSSSMLKKKVLILYALYVMFSLNIISLGLFKIINKKPNLNWLPNLIIIYFFHVHNIYLTLKAY